MNSVRVLSIYFIFMTYLTAQTFKVCDVVPAKEPLDQIDGAHYLKTLYGKYHQASSLNLNEEFIHAELHPLIEASSLAFTQHPNINSKLHSARLLINDQQLVKICQPSKIK